MQEDSQGAMWFYTSDGLVRNNGHSSTSFDKSLLKGNISFNGSDRIYAVSKKGVLYVDTLHPDSLSVKFSPGIELSTRTRVLSYSDSLLVSEDDRLYLVSPGAFSVFARTPDSSPITALLRSSSGNFIVGTSSGVLFMDGKETLRSIPTASSVSSLYEDSENGSLVVGLSAGGFFTADIESGEVLSRFQDCRGKKMQLVRSFCKACNGCIYIAASNGLFRLSPDGRLEEIPVGGKLSTPLYEVYADSSGNLWVCTFFDGVFYSNLASYPFRPAALPESSPVSGMSQDSFGTIWAATDGNGLFRLTEDGWTMVSGTAGIKYQRTFTVDGVEGIFVSDWYGNLMHYCSTGRSVSVARLNRVPASERNSQITSLHMTCTGFLIGTKNGLFAFNPAKETTMTRTVDCAINEVKKIAEGPDGRIWIAGNGLACYEGDSFSYILKDDHRLVNDFDFDEDGILWGCTSSAVFRVDEGEISFTKKFDSQKLVKIIALSGHRLFILTKKRVIIYDTTSGKTVFYDEEAGLTPGSSRMPPCIKTSDGNVWVAWKEGIEVFDPSKVRMPDSRERITVDKVTAGSRIVWHPDEAIVVSHNEHDIVFDITDFDYTGIGKSDFEYRLEGYDKNWIAQDAPAPVSYFNLRPGRYTLRARVGNSPQDEVSCQVRINPVWYASVPAIIIEILLVLSLIIYILHNRYVKAVLNEKLRLKNEEYEKQTNFFINLSFKMRTPINLIIGQLEQYFKDCGPKARGVENIQKVYKRTKDLREMISEYVDTQNGALEKEPRNARIINAVLGAIERNISTKDLNVTLLCDELNMGKTKLTAVVKEATGMSPGEYIEDTRLRYAAEMLNNGNYTVGEISDRLGFSSISYFSTRFKKKYGVTPSAWKSSESTT